MSIVQAISRPGVRRSRPSSAADAKLVGRVRSGDERAFEAIFKRHHAPLLSYARHMLASQDEAEDALQQAFIKAHRALLGGTVPRELRPWLYGIVRNCCLSAIAARRHAVELDEYTANLSGLSEVVHEREDLRELLADIGRLPEDQRSALLLAELDDLSHQSIAKIVGCPVTKVKALIYQARSTLIADRDARGASCRDIREELAVARGGELRRGPLRRHLSLCVGCRDFQKALAAQRHSLAVVLPVLPSAGLAAKILSHGALQAASAAGQAGGAVGSAAAPAGAVAGGGASVGTAASTAATGASAAAGSGGTGAVVGGGVLAKVAVGGAVAALATAGAVTTVHHLAHRSHRYLAHTYVDRAHRSQRTPSAEPPVQLSRTPLTSSATASTAALDATGSGREPAAAAVTDAVLSNPLSQPTPQSSQTPTLTSALLPPPATSAAMVPTGMQTPNGQGTQPQGGSSGTTAPVISHRRRLEGQRGGLQRLRRIRQAERQRLLVERRRLRREERLRKARELKEAKERRQRLREERLRKARELKEAKERRERLREERLRKARELKEAKERRERLREERLRKARELKEAKERRERLREERLRKAQELEEAKERRELEAQREREQQEAASTAPKPSTQTTQSTPPVATTTPSTEAPSTASTEATGTDGKRKRKKS
jgi:RNA polymerase sigma factor (sigma-70 family)